MELKNIDSKSRLCTIVFPICALALFFYSLDPSYGIRFQTENIFMLMERGEDLQQEGKFLESISSFQKAYDHAANSENLNLQLKSLKHLGILHWNIGKIEDSVHYFNAALEIADKPNFEKERSFFSAILALIEHYSQGREYNRQKEYLKSVESFDSAIDLSRQINSREHELKCLRQLSITYWDMSDLEKFFLLNEQGLKIAREINHKAEIGRALNNIGLYYSLSGSYSMSLIRYFEALDIARRSENSIGLSDNLNNIANVYMNLGNYEKSLEYLTEALKIDEQVGDERLVSMDFNNLGELYRRLASKQGGTDYLYKALEKFEKCLALAEKIGDKATEIISLNNIGNIFLNLNDYQNAYSFLQMGLTRSKESRNSESIGMILSNMGFVYLFQNKYIKAEQYFHEAIDNGTKIGAINVLWESYFGLGKTLERRNELSEAISCYRKSIELIDHVRSRIALDIQKAGYVRNKLKVYESLVALYYRMYRSNKSNEVIAEMFNATEKAKSRALIDTLSASEFDIRDKLNPNLSIREKEISEKIANNLKLLTIGNISDLKRGEIEQQLLDAENEYTELISYLRVEIPELAEIVSPNPYSLDYVKEHLLNDETALIEYYLGEEQSFIFYVSKMEIRLSELPPLSVIHQSIKAYLKMLSEPPRITYESERAARRLFEELLAPVLKDVPNNISHLIIIPDGSLFYMPFETLFFGTTTTSLLVNRFSVSYMPSASSLLYLTKLNRQTQAKKDLLAFGNPDYSQSIVNRIKKTKNSAQILLELYKALDYDFSPLPYSEKEVRKASKYFRKKNSNILLKNHATEEALKSLPLEDYRVIHFACHGFIDEIFPFRSALVLSLDDGSKEDGFLQVREIYNLRLNAELVVLSACQTGRGRLEYGEGVLGLPRIFFYAGARSVLSTLWSIGDKPTAIFMEFFYKYLSKGYSKAKALRLTKLKMIESKYSHPFYWAAFVLNGDYENSIF